MGYVQHNFTTNKTTPEMPTALCISEDKAFLNTVRVNLGKSGFVVVITSNPTEAAVLAEDNKIDAIVCDYDLSQTDGITLFETIQQQKGEDNTPPTLIVSEQYAAPLLARCVNAGTAGLHSKAEPIESLVERVISVLRDAELRNELERTSPKRAVQGGTDPLTKIATKHHFSRRFSAESVASYRDHNAISLLLMSIDRYDLLEERHGSQQAEGALANAARIIEGELRSRDCVGRYSDHTFAVVLPETAHNAATSVGDRLRRILGATEFGNLDHPIMMTVSAGVASRPAGLRASPDELLTQALRNCEAAKKLGGDKVVADKKLSGKPVALLLANPSQSAIQFAQDLEQSNVEVRLVGTVDDAKHTLQSVPTAIIAVLQPFPEQDGGADFLIWSRNKYPKIQRVLVSNNVNPQLMHKAVNHAAINYFVPNPWEKSEIGDIIEKIGYD